MRISRLPPEVIDRLDVVGRHSDTCAQAALLAERNLSDVRDLINGKVRVADHQVLLRAQSTFQETLEAAQERRRRADAARRVASSVKVFIAGLADDTAIELIEPPRANGVDLSECRRRIAVLRAEIHKLKIAPVPSPDIEQRVTSYIDMLARKPVMVRGLRAGENLDFLFPMSPDASVRGGYAPLTANPLMLAARFHRDALIADLLAAIEQEVAEPLPPSERPTRIAELEGQLAQLQSLEVMFVDRAIESGATDIVHDPATAPAIILGVRCQA